MQIDQIKKVGGKQIKFMCIIAAPEGVEKLHKAHPDVQIYIGHLDRELNADMLIFAQDLGMPETESSELSK